ncbi:melanoma receptor tyrosine-protein kinase, partial [Austrofundulus limnaeus]
PTHGPLDKEDFSYHEYQNQNQNQNQTLSETRRSSKLSEVLNPHYEDLDQDWGATSFSSLQGESKFPPGPEYLNISQNSLLNYDVIDNPDYKSNFLPLTEALNEDRKFLPAAENLEYLGLGTALHAPVR